MALSLLNHGHTARDVAVDLTADRRLEFAVPSGLARWMITKGFQEPDMRIRNHEINQRRQRQEKRRRLRKKLAAATAPEDRNAILEKIRKTYPKYTPEVQS